MAYNAPSGDFVTSSLSGVLSAGATSATIGTGILIPATNGVLQISYDTINALGATNGPETISYASYTTGTGALAGLVRGLAGTTGVQHDNGQSVQSAPSSLYFGNDMSWQTANQTWARASSTTITVPAGAASIYSVGDKIRFKQNAGTYVYFYVVAVADTVLTLTGGTDYTVANETITANDFSQLTSPVGFPQWFALTAPTFAVASYDNGSGGQPTTSEYRFCINGRSVQIHYRGNGTKAGTDNQIIFALAGLPKAPANSTDRTCLGCGYIEAGSSQVLTVMTLSTDAYCMTNTNIADNQAVANFSINLSYEI